MGSYVIFILFNLKKKRQRLPSAIQNSTILVNGGACRVYSSVRGERECRGLFFFNNHVRKLPKKRGSVKQIRESGNDIILQESV